MLKKKLYYKISEVCEITKLRPSVLRFWEKEFKQLAPFKTSTKRRLYTSEDIDKIENIKDLLYNKRMTIEGAKKFLEKPTEGFIQGATNSEEIVKNIKKELSEIVAMLRK